MKRKSFIIILLTVLSYVTIAQNTDRFLGQFELTERCVVTMPWTDSLTFYNIIEIMESNSDSSDLDIRWLIELDTVRVLMTSDTSFDIPYQTFHNLLDSTLVYTSGKAVLFDNSLDLEYSKGGSAGIIECDCKGIKRNATKLIDTTKSWSVVTAISNADSNDDNISASYFKFTKDTVISKSNYSVLSKFEDIYLTQKSKSFYLKEQNDSVFLYNQETSIE